MKSIYAAFVAAQRNFAPAIKSSTNPHFKSRYVDLAGCIDAVIDALNEQGLGLIQTTNQVNEGGVTVATMLIHESGESMTFGEFFVPASKQDPQGYGSALTYARRYSLMAAMSIAPEDDDGNAASRQIGSKPVPKPVAKPATVFTFDEMLDKIMLATKVTDLEALRPAINTQNEEDKTNLLLAAKKKAEKIRAEFTEAYDATIAADSTTRKVDTKA